MKAGLTVFLDNGSSIQIDDTFVNLGLISKHSLYCGTRPTGWVYPHGYLTIPGISPIIAIKSAAKFAVNSCSVSNGQFTYDIVTEYATTVEVFVFDVPTTFGTFGLQTFREDGSLCFDSSRKYMRVVASYDYAHYNSVISSPPPIPQGDMALVINAFIGAVYTEYEGGHDNGPTYFNAQRDMLFCNTANGVISARYIYTVFSNRGGVGNGSPWNSEHNRASFQVIDVSGF